MRGAFHHHLRESLARAWDDLVAKPRRGFRGGVRPEFPRRWHHGGRLTEVDAEKVDAETGDAAFRGVPSCGALRRRGRRGGGVGFRTEEPTA
ncbi:MAG: hypothetical protein ACLTDR_12690 [Adlercreutzia equolifaciens]